MAKKAKLSRAERRAEPLPSIEASASYDADPEPAAESSAAPPPPSKATAKVKPAKPLTKRQREKRERGVDLAAKLDVKRQRAAGKKARREGAKKVYE